MLTSVIQQVGHVVPRADDQDSLLDRFAGCQDLERSHGFLGEPLHVWFTALERAVHKHQVLQVVVVGHRCVRTKLFSQTSLTSFHLCSTHRDLT